MRNPPRRPPALTNKIFRGSTAIRKGWLTRGDLRSSAWQPLFRDIYADRAVAITHKLKCLAVSNYLLPEGAAVAGRSAAHLHGVPYIDSGHPVEVLSPRAFGPVKGLVVHRGPLGETEIVRHGRLAFTTPLRTCWDVARWLELAEAMIFLDALASKRIVSAAALIEYATARSGSTGWSRVLRAARLIDPAAESPQESRLRIRLVLAGLPRPVAQHVITRNGTFVARVDLAWPELKIAVEYDGRWHADPSQLERDRRRLNQILGADWLVFHVTAQQMRHGLHDVIAQLRSAIRARSQHMASAARRS